MLRRILTAVILIACASTAYARGHYFDFASSGSTVSTAGFTSSSKAIKTYPGATYTVYLPGTTTLATIYSDSAGTAGANPGTASTSDGSISFWIDLPSFDIKLSGTGITTSCGSTFPGYPCVAAFTKSGVAAYGGTRAVYNVRDYGCVGDGGTSDTTCFANAVAAIRTAVGSATFYIPKGRYVVSGKMDFTLNSLVQEGDVVGTNGITIEGDGALDSLVYCETNTDPCIDTVGRDHMTMRNFGLIGQGGVGVESVVGILMGRSTLGQSANPQNYDLHNVYIDIRTSQAGVNSSYGTIGIYNRGCVETSTFENLKVIANIPLVLTKDNVASISSSGVLNGSGSSCAQNKVSGGYYYSLSGNTNLTASAILMQGVQTTSIRDITTGRGSSTQVYPFRIQQDNITPSNVSHKVIIENVQIEAPWDRFAYISAPCWNCRFQASISMAAAATGNIITLDQANAALVASVVNLSPTNYNTAQSTLLINDTGAATGGLYGSTFYLYKGFGGTPLSMGINAATTPCGGNTIYWTGTGQPTYTCSNVDNGVTIHGQDGTFQRLISQSVTFANLGTPTNGAVVYCSDCDPPAAEGNTCTSAGAKTGAEAHRLRAGWSCFGH